METSNDNRERGRVKWFDPQKGYGFLQLSGNSESIFVHQSEIKMAGYRTLEENAEVEFTIEQCSRGFHARNVVPVKSAVATQ